MAPSTHTTSRTTLINRKPGGYAGTLARRHGLRAGAAALVILWVAVLVYKYAPHRQLITVPTVAAGVVIVAAGWLFRRERALSRRAAIGARSEKRVAKELRSLRPVGLANSLMLGAGGDADHVVIGPWLALVETKTGYGALRVEGTTLWAGTRPIPGDPLAQVTRQAGAVHRATGTACDAIVCVVDTTSAPFRHRGVTVCSLADLPGVLEGLPSRLDADRALAVYHELVALDRVETRATTMSAAASVAASPTPTAAPTPPESSRRRLEWRSAQR